MNGGETGATGITQHDLLTEMREDIKGLKATVDAIAKDQTLVLATLDPIGARRVGIRRSSARSGWTWPSPRHCPATTDLPITMRPAEPPESCEWLRSA